MEHSVLAGKCIAFFSHYDFNLYRFRGALMQSLVEHGVKVYAIAPPGSYTDKFKELGVTFVPFPMNRRTLNPVVGWRSVLKLSALLKTLKPDLLHTFTLRPNLYGAIAGTKAKVPVIIATVTGLGSFYIEEGIKVRLIRRVLEYIMKRTLKKVQAVIFQNRDDLSYFIKRKLCASEKAFLIPGSGIDVNEFDPEKFSQDVQKLWRNRWGIPQDAVVVLMVSRLIRHKGVYEFIKAAEKLQGKAFFVLIGEHDPGNPASLTKQEVEELSLRKVVLFPGWQSDIAAWMAVADIYVLPSYREGLPRTVLEAMAMALPVISTNVPGCREVVEHGKTGFLIPPRDVNALVKAIQQLIENPSLRKEMGQQGRKVVCKRFSTDRIIKEYFLIYNKLFKLKSNSKV